MENCPCKTMILYLKNGHSIRDLRYIWLPLFIDPANPRHVKVVWQDEWLLDDESLYPF